MKMLKRIFRVLILVLLIIFIGFGIFLFYFTLKDYQPLPVEETMIYNRKPTRLIDSVPLTFISWNIGYCGLSKEMDFFYDGGSMVRPDKNMLQKNLNGVFDFLSTNDSVDFLLIQEIDSSSRRSYYTNQVSIFGESVKSHCRSYATNYHVGFVPLPVLKPMGKVLSGLATFSKYMPEKCERYAYPVNYFWPMKIFMLDRCFMLQRHKLSFSNKELVIINLHNSAFADADLLRQYETWMLRGFLLNEYEKGNYVIAGGDWNQNPSAYDQLSFMAGYAKKTGMPKVMDDLLPPAWKFVFDTLLPTNRDNNTPYRHGITPTTIYDFFVVSPNITVEQINVIDSQFEFSDHQPVFMRVMLNPDPFHNCADTVKEYVTGLQDSVQKLNEKYNPASIKPKPLSPLQKSQK